MIDSIEIKNFRCFKGIEIHQCQRFNLIVGDNGAGKTALLEAIFMTLTGNVEVSLRLRALRGFDSNFQGSPALIEEAIWRDYFYNSDWKNEISVKLNGSGVEARSMTIARAPSQVIVPFGFENPAETALSSNVPLVFDWQDAAGQHFIQTPRITPQGIQMGAILEDLSNFYLFGAYQAPPAVETAGRFSQLSRESQEGPFIDTLRQEYPWIQNLNIEVVGGFPVIHVTLSTSKRKVPLNAVSGGINRIVSILLAIAASKDGVVVVDEIENGLYYKHKAGIWRAILNLARIYNCQLFLTTHDEELLEALVEASEGAVDDIALWRLERKSDGPFLRQFSGRTFKAGIDTGGEVR